MQGEDARQMPLAQRIAVMVVSVVMVAVVFVAVAWSTADYWWPSHDGRTLTPAEAHALATSGAITLVDIRRPGEWAATGIGEGAAPLDMRREDFLTALAGLVDGDRAAPIALICARGVRSARLASALDAAGFTSVSDVPEGMLGAPSGPGWVARGLPVEPL